MADTAAAFATECPNALIANPTVRKAIQVVVAVLSSLAAALVGTADDLHELGLLSETAVAVIRMVVNRAWPVITLIAALLAAANVPLPEIRRGMIPSVIAGLEEAEAGEGS